MTSLHLSNELISRVLILTAVVQYGIEILSLSLAAHSTCHATSFRLFSPSVPVSQVLFVRLQHGSLGDRCFSFVEAIVHYAFHSAIPLSFRFSFIACVVFSIGESMTGSSVFRCLLIFVSIATCFPST